MMLSIPVSAIVLLGTVAVATAQTAPAPRTPAQTPPRPPASTPAQAPARPAATPAPAAAAQPEAPRPPFPAEAKIGYIDIQQILDHSKLGKIGQDKMKELTDRKQAEVSAKNKEIQAKQTEIQSGQTLLSPTVLTQKQAELDRLQREAQLLQDQAHADVDTLNTQLLEDFKDKVLPIIEQIRVERGLWFVLTTGDTLIAANLALDLSPDVVQRLDAAK